MALDEKQRNEAKQVPFFVPAAFKESPSKRSYDKALHCNLIFLDIDPEKERREGKWIETGRFPAAPFVREPELLNNALEAFNFVAHVTASSTPERPRMRVVVDAEKIPLSEYPRAVATIGALLGLPSITRESSVAVQPMFLPTLFKDSPDDYSPIIACNLDGRAFRLSDINDSLDSFHGASGATNSRPSVPEQGADVLEYLRAPVPEVTLGVAKEALFSIDPDLSYHEWLDMAAALRHQFSPHKEEEAYELFDAWSAKGSKYAGDKETRAKWRSLKASPAGRLPITIRTLLRKAQEHGWNEKRVKEDIFLKLNEWLEDVPTVVELMEQGVKRIIAAPLLSAMQEDILVGKICGAAKRRFSHALSASAVRKDLNRAKEEIRQLAEKPTEINEKWATDVCYIIGADEFFRYRTGEKMKTAAFNAAYSRHLLPTKAQLLASGNPITLQAQSTPLVLPSHYALNFIKIPEVYDYAYVPAQPNEKFFVENGKRFLNVYQPTYPTPDPKNAARAGKLLMRHLEHLVAEAEYRRVLLDFMAFMVQFPGRKIRWGVLLQSSEGAGKTFLAETMRAVLGPEHVRVIDGAAIKSGWNEWSFGTQLVVIEEVRVVGTSKHEIMNALKPLITNNQIAINERFRNSREVPNITNYFLFSNHHDALALTPGDRRYFVIKSPLQSRAQVLALGEDYFPPLYDVLRDYPGAMRSFLADWEISPEFDPNSHAPRTSYVQEMVNDSASELTATIRRLLLEGDFPLIQYDIVSATKLKDVLLLEEGMDRVTSQQIAQVLREEGLHGLGRQLVGSEHHYLWSRNGSSEQEIIQKATDREKRQLKNLSMELLF